MLDGGRVCTGACSELPADDPGMEQGKVNICHACVQRVGFTSICNWCTIPSRLPWSVLPKPSRYTPCLHAPLPRLAIVLVHNLAQATRQCVPLVPATCYAK